MARPKQFDPDLAAQEAMEAFWENGYNATSVSDLLIEMGLNKGSLYGTFGDKKKLFLAALNKYQDQNVAIIRDVLDRPGSARAAIEALLQLAVERCTGEEAARGCLAAKAAMELAAHDPDISAWIKRFHERKVELVAQTIRRGQQQGEIDRDLDARAVARFLLNGVAGLYLSGMTGPSEEEVQDVVRLMLKVLK
jgi:TetR/AcrR family transcriptional regulator, transcriptional repressor for nem operon